MILVYLLPTGNKSYTLWSPVGVEMGELPDSRVVILSPHFLDDAEVEEAKALIHDNLYRIQMRRGLPVRMSESFWFRMIWGFLALLALRDPMEDLLWGLYLLVGLPVMVNIVEGIWKRHQRKVERQFNAAVYWPEIEVVISPALQRLTRYIETWGKITALHNLYALGLPELIGFYRRAAWSRRWEVGPPIGLGVFKKEEGIS